MNTTTEQPTTWMEQEDLDRIAKGIEDLESAPKGNRGGYALNLACYALEAVPESDPLGGLLDGVHDLLWRVCDSWPVKNGVFISHV